MRARKMQLKEFKNNVQLEIVLLIILWCLAISVTLVFFPLLPLYLAQGTYLLKYQGKPFRGVSYYSGKLLS